jgi:hypothetical protein
VLRAAELSLPLFLGVLHHRDFLRGIKLLGTEALRRVRAVVS